MMAGERPIYWSPEYLLECMEDGETPSSVLRRAAKDCPEGPEIRTYWNDIYAWRRDPGFRERYEAAQQHLPSLHSSHSPGRPPEFNPAVQRDFIQEMIFHGGDYRQAAYEVGVGPSVVLAKINPKSASYDPNFHQLFTMAESGLHDRIYEEFESRAFADGELRDNWMFVQFAKGRAAHLFDPKRVVEIEGMVQHNHFLSTGLQNQLEQQRRALLPPGQRQTEEEVVDVEYEETGP